MGKIRIGKIVIRDKGLVIELTPTELSVITEKQIGNKINKNGKAIHIDSDTYEYLCGLFDFISYNANPMIPENLRAVSLDYIYFNGEEFIGYIQEGHDRIKEFDLLMKFLAAHGLIKSTVSKSLVLARGNLARDTNKLREEICKTIDSVIGGELKVVDIRTLLLNNCPKIAGNFTDKELYDEIWKIFKKIHSCDKNTSFNGGTLLNLSYFKFYGRRALNKSDIGVFHERLYHYLNKVTDPKEGKFKKDTEVYSAVGLDNRSWPRFKNPSYAFNRETILMFCIVMELTIDETNDLLLAAGYCLNPKLPLDKIYYEHIIDGDYDVDKINADLKKANINASLINACSMDE